MSRKESTALLRGPFRILSHLNCIYLYAGYFVFLQAENRFITQNENHVNNLNRAHYTLWCSNYWLTNRVRLIGALVCFLVGIFLVASVRTKNHFYVL